MPVISHLSFSRSGGAGEVMRRLSATQKSRGWDSQTITLIDTNLRSEPLSAPLHTAAAIFDQRAIKSPEFRAPISLLRDSLSMGLSRVPKDTGLLHLHWLNGVTDLRRIARHIPGVPIVWTLHDMNPFTGACHQSLGCQLFETGCSHCPAVRGEFHGMVHRNFDNKKRFLGEAAVVLVAPSVWLAEQAKSSPITQGHPLHVIPNPLPSQKFRMADPTTLPLGPIRRVVVVASDLSDPLKAVADVVRAHQSSPEIWKSLELNLVGAHGLQWASGDNIVCHGVLEKKELDALLSGSESLVAASYGESFGLSVIEAAARGAAPLVRGSGALEEIQKSLGAGTVFTTDKDLRDALAMLVRTPPTPNMRQRLAKRALEIYSAENVGRKYETLYEELGVML